jgi:hypothetical protein
MNPDLRIYDLLIPISNEHFLFTFLFQIIRDMRRPSAHYITRGRLKFRFVQVLVNAVALLAIAGGLAAYFRGEEVPQTFARTLCETGLPPL